MLFWFFHETNRGEDINRNTMRFSDIGDFHHSSPFFPQQDAVDLTSSNFLFFYMCFGLEKLYSIILFISNLNCFFFFCRLYV